MYKQRILAIINIINGGNMADIEQRAGYNEYVKAKMPKTKPFPTLLWAFVIGG